MCRLSDIESNHNAGQQTSREDVGYLLAVIRSYDEGLKEISNAVSEHPLYAEAACEEPELEENEDA